MCREITDEPLLIRLDSGNDAAENIGILIEAGCYFIIKRNLRKESREEWLRTLAILAYNILRMIGQESIGRRGAAT